MRYKGKIRELNHIIISDPSYDESVTCRYENNNLKEKDWYVKEAADAMAAGNLIYAGNTIRIPKS